MGKYQAMVTTSGQGIKKVKKKVYKEKQKLSTCIYFLTTTRFLERNEINATKFEKMPSVSELTFSLLLPSLMQKFPNHGPPILRLQTEVTPIRLN